MHNHVIAGDFGYLPTYGDEEGYTYKSEALEGLKEYVNMVVDSFEGFFHFPGHYKSIEDYWLSTGVVTDIGTDGCNDTIQAVFDRNIASIDYAEITVCYEDCKPS